MKKNIVTLDLETTIKNKDVGKFKASPHLPQNYAVYLGTKLLGYKPYIVKNTLTNIRHIRQSFINELKATDILVGQNIKFDLLYLLKDIEFREEVFPTMTVWDTMVVEYLLTGQESTNTSLDDLATKYGGTLKNDVIKELWAQDVQTEDIDEDLMREYLEGDLTNTEIVFLGQIEQAVKMDMMPLIKSQMSALLAITEMEYNGMYFDKAKAAREKEILNKTLLRAKTDVEGIIKASLPYVDANAASNQQISLVLFGGTYEYYTNVPIIDDNGNQVVFKSGKNKGMPRFKKELRSGTALPAFRTARPSKYKATETKTKGIYTVNDEVLQEILKEPILSTLTSKFVQNILQFRKLQKDIKTYYDGYSELVWPYDSCIHGNINQAVTTTGRFSHSAPNLGNVSHNKGD